MSQASDWRARVARLKKLDCCAVSDAVDKLGLPNRAVVVPHRSGPTRVAGRVVTVKLGVGDPPPGPPRHLGATAIEAAEEGEIIVVEQRTGVQAGCWGGLLTTAAKAKGVAAVIADGPLRDVEESCAHDFTIYATSTTARTARGRVVEKATNVPVTVNDAEVHPGDFVVADSGAIVFVSAADIDAVLEAAEAIVERETRMARALESGIRVSEVLSGAYENMLQRDK